MHGRKSIQERAPPPPSLVFLFESNSNLYCSLRSFSSDIGVVTVRYIPPCCDALITPSQVNFRLTLVLLQYDVSRLVVMLLSTRCSAIVHRYVVVVVADSLCVLSRHLWPGLVSLRCA